VHTGDELRSLFRGCLLGGAVGDAIGAGIEFMSLAAIRREFGPAGVTGYVSAYGRTGAITDDTQMTLFTAEGLIRARQAQADATAAIWRAYQRWLATQSGPSPLISDYAETGWDGWLIDQPFLHHSRSPGVTCMSALQGSTPGSVASPVNDSKGCGGVMRVAPVGLVATDPFGLGCEVAALTHGHPSGYLAAGAFALILSEIAGGRGLADATAAAVSRLDAVPDSGQVRKALAAALRSADAQPADTQTLTALGEGWVAEEALAMAVYCALSAGSFRSGVLLAANHGGDSDSTAAICGNLLGADLGTEAIDPRLLGDLEGREVIEQVADDLFDVFVTGRAPTATRYPAS
jgi:ADP-ribosyl-[dinitrogen reductase] hydrolase